MVAPVRSLAGGCLCGAVRYEILGEPSSVSLCHCRTCRRASGAPVVSWFVVSREQLSLSGELVPYASSSPVTRGFCGKCGTPVTYVHADDPNSIELTTASLDQPELVVPTREIWLSEKITWMPTDSNREHFLTH
jgi:hypothetical protein